MKQQNNSKRMSISLDKEYKNRLTCLAELEHRRLGEQIIHMTEFYISHQLETKNRLEEYMLRLAERSTNTPEFTNPSVEIKTKSQALKTSQVLQENKGVVVSDVRDKKVKTEFENQQDV